ncbi:hypothetical protein V6N13_105576 [Hibiscus sabdariffa]|uniref:Uncharacterized protein n=1 Tax=Hibiscus sabdariffa TaxID=183260 RepID=A0ABR2EY45_9ROSI
MHRLSARSSVYSIALKVIHIVDVSVSINHPETCVAVKSYVGQADSSPVIGILKSHFHSSCSHFRLILATQVSLRYPRF